MLFKTQLDRGISCTLVSLAYNMAEINPRIELYISWIIVNSQSSWRCESSRRDVSRGYHHQLRALFSKTDQGGSIILKSEDHGGSIIVKTEDQEGKQDVGLRRLMLFKTQLDRGISWTLNLLYENCISMKILFETLVSPTPFLCNSRCIKFTDAKICCLFSISHSKRYIWNEMLSSDALLSIFLRTSYTLHSKKIFLFRFIFWALLHLIFFFSAMKSCV